MRNDLRLFIDGKEVEFSSDPRILLNYKEKELTNPTVVRNSFSKQITVEGTNRNNEVFGNIWDLTRVQDGSNFNPIQKTGFELYMNDELFQKGYAKLDKVTRRDNGIQYVFTLYGGLGSFFHNLSFEPGSDTRKTLYSLRYTTRDGEPHPDLDFTISKDAVRDAWRQINRESTGGEPRWDVINFVPAYEGYPEFDADKALINNSGMDGTFVTAVTDGGKTYTPMLNGVSNRNGYSLATLSEPLTEWESFDLRSYIQRPAISVYRIIEACRDPMNNGGYEVKLDDHFFNYGNPYYYDAWMTLPSIRETQERSVETEDVTGVTLTKDGKNGYRVNYTLEHLTSLDNVRMRLGVTFNPTGQTVAPELVTRRDYSCSRINAGLTTGTYVKRYRYNSGVILRVDALDAAGNVVGKSRTYLLSSDRNYPGTSNPLFYWFPGEDGNAADYLQGKWVRSGGTYTFADDNGNPVDIDFTFPSDVRISSLRMTVRTNWGYVTKYAVAGSGGHQMKDGDSDETVNLYTSRYYSTTGKHTAADAMSQDAVRGKYGLVVRSFEAQSETYEGLYSNTPVSASKLLSGDKTPADYLLSYCKLFGLYFYHDSTEESEDPQTYPSGVVHIMDRDTFYTEEYVDLQSRIDWGKNVEITPAMADAKWYRFKLDQVEGAAAVEYRETYSQDYGTQLVNTNYNFDTNTRDLYDGNAFRDATQVWEKDKYFKVPSGLDIPNYAFNGMTYELFAPGDDGLDTYEERMPSQTTDGWNNLNTLGYDWYDTFPKVQFHDREQGQVDGAGVLLFYAGPHTGRAYYNITDDVYEMISLNGGTPCWIMTNNEFDGGGNRIAYRTRTLPRFTRDLTYMGVNGNIVHSWNFGHPRVTFAPDTYTTEGDSIYDKCWKDYIRDTYDVDTRKLSCYVKAEMDGRPWPYWFRRFYWFENSIWRLNEIKDLNPGSFDTVRMEFVKVQDVDDYRLNQIRREGSNGLRLSTRSIGCQGGEVTGTVYLQGGGNWGAPDFISGEDTHGNAHYLPTDEVMTPLHGGGTESVLTIDFPPNTAGTKVTWNVAVLDDMDNRLTDWIEQDECEETPYMTVSPTAQTINATGGTHTITLDTNASDWAVASNPGWVTITPYSTQGNLIYLTLTASANTGSQRTGTLTFTGGSGALSATVNLTQEASAPATVFVWVRPESGNRTAQPYYETTWWELKASSDVSDVGAWLVTGGEWITGIDVEQGSGIYGATHAVNLYFPENEGNERYGSFNVSGATSTGGTVTLTGNITQYSGSTPAEDRIAISPTAVTMPATGGTTYLSYSTTGTVTGISVSVNAAWAAVVLEGSTVRLSVTENTTATAKTATITITGNGGAVSATASLTQREAGPELRVEAPTAKTVDADVTTVAFRYVVKGGVSDIGVVWTGSWITNITLTYPYIYITQETNGTDTARTANIRITGRTASGVISSSCVLEQNGESLRLQPDTLLFGYNSGEIKTTSVYTNNNWRVTDIRDV